jgi:ribonucleoside-diphosphate reductase alpha chain
MTILDFSSKSITFKNVTGQSENLDLNVVLNEFKILATDIQPILSNISLPDIVSNISKGLINGMTIDELHTYYSEVCASMISIHPEYDDMAARIIIQNLHNNTSKDFYDVMKTQEKVVHKITGKVSNYLSERFLNVLEQNKELIQKKIDYSRDFRLGYFGFKTLKYGYLYKKDGLVVAERPQHLFMKTALGIWAEDIEKAFKTYDLMSLGKAMHATPTLFNAATMKNQLSSCFLISGDSVMDSIDGITDIERSASKILSSGGGLAISLGHIRAKGSYIIGSNGIASGLRLLLKCFNEKARYVDQGKERYCIFNKLK